MHGYDYPGVLLPWPGPVLAINFRGFKQGFRPSVTNGVVLELNYAWPDPGAPPVRICLQQQSFHRSIWLIIFPCTTNLCLSNKVLHVMRVAMQPPPEPTPCAHGQERICGAPPRRPPPPGHHLPLSAAYSTVRKNNVTTIVESDQPSLRG
jgi:hypothetical protein